MSRASITTHLQHQWNINHLSCGNIVTLHALSYKRYENQWYFILLSDPAILTCCASQFRFKRPPKIRKHNNMILPEGSTELAYARREPSRPPKIRKHNNVILPESSTELAHARREPSRPPKSRKHNNMILETLMI